MATGINLMSDDIIIKCCVCFEENRKRAAEKYCTECKEYFCSSCVGLHKKIPSMKDHKILEKGDFPSRRPYEGLPSYPTMRCVQHRMKVIDMYCRDHDVVECASCIALSHRSCRNIVSIPEEISNLNQEINLNEVKENIRITKKTMEEIKKTNEAQVQEIREAFNIKINSVKTFKKELQDLLDDMEQQTIQELKEEFDQIQESLAAEMNEVESLISALNETAHCLSKSEGNEAQEFVCVKSFQKLTVNGREIEKRNLMATKETVSFIPDQSIETYLQQMKSLGKISRNKADNQEHFPEDRLYKIKQRREINVKLKNDSETCDIWGSCMTKDGFLLLADSSNKKLKRIDMSSEKIKDCIALQDSCSAVCTVGKNEAAVTLYNKTVQFVLLGDRMIATYTLKMKHNCYGLAYKDDKLFIGDGKAVYIYDKKGQEHRRITLDSSCKGIFQSNEHIVVSARGERVYIADWHKGVIVFDSEENYLGTDRDSIVSGYRGVCTDDRNVFVSGYLSQNIVQFGHDFKMLGEIGKVDSAPSVCFDYQKMRLISTLGNNNKITIFELE